MARRPELRARQHALTQVREVLAAMKNLSMAEALKLRPSLEAQQSGMQVLERAVSDFLGHYGRRLHPHPAGGRKIYLLIGSERGFCGAFNDNLWRTWEAEAAGASPAVRIALAGARLGSRYGNDPRVAVTLPLPARANELAGVLKELYSVLGDGLTAASEFTVIYNEESDAGLVTRAVKPFSRFRRPEARLDPYPPRLHRRPTAFLPELADEYLARLLSLMFLTSAIAENLQRARHLEGAVREIDRRLEDVGFRLNAAVQEATTEEIEEIMLGVTALM